MPPDAFYVWFGGMFRRGRHAACQAKTGLSCGILRGNEWTAIDVVRRERQQRRCFHAKALEIFEPASAVLLAPGEMSAGWRQTNGCGSMFKY